MSRVHTGRRGGSLGVLCVCRGTKFRAESRRTRCPRTYKQMVRYDIKYARIRLCAHHTCDKPLLSPLPLLLATAGVFGLFDLQGTSTRRKLSSGRRLRSTSVLTGIDTRRWLPVSTASPHFCRCAERNVVVPSSVGGVWGDLCSCFCRRCIVARCGTSLLCFFCFLYPSLGLRASKSCALLASGGLCFCFRASQGVLPVVAPSFC